MNQNAYYHHINGERYRCEIIEETKTQVRVRFPEETAMELKLDDELWLPKSHVKAEE
jgi:hypothetical protein